ncbi:GGDEF domain-containing protein [Clostridium bowmanii]|uniref:GGDEF domain-containing protein n=1 Tax=Clostridium bowmanii TaxID=132925 RepID=UPI001C0D02D8|nr:GGDEF domain-containing protein [Clostridium bowmanii]MBU3188140.1 GGDEF domain-containing protein [Clostridium bowmanii]MCA1072322.1 GGDEF domain-containing protein [Clostridium bowmanii]
MNKSLQNRRKTIGVLINSFDGFYQSPVCRGIKQVALERNLDVLFFAGGALNSPLPDEAKQNVIYDLVNTDKLDGLIICTGLVYNYIGIDKFIEFLEPYRHIPMVSLGIDIKDIPSIIFDNRQCMHSMINHLIEHHNYSKIAFITGTSLNSESVMRFEGYKDALKEHNIPFDEELIAEGDFHRLSAAKAVDDLIVYRKKKPQVIVVSNDEMAIEVFYSLKHIGIEVGVDIALTGFDNVEAARSFSPAFTTIEQPIFEMASLSTKFIDEITDGQSVPQCTYLKGKLIIRESCGCYNILKNKAPLSLKSNLSEVNVYYKECESLEKYLNNQKFHLVDLIIRELGMPLDKILEYTPIIINLLNAFIRDIKARKIEGDFIEGFKNLLFDSIFEKKLDYSWNETLYTIRNFILPYINNYEVLRIADEIFYMASILIGNIFNKRESIQQFNFKRMYIGTRDILREFNTIPNVEELTKVIITAMSLYEIKQCYVCVYDTPVTSLYGAKTKLPSRSKLILGYNQGKIAETQYLDTQEILPAEFIGKGKRNELILFPLVTGVDYFGYIAFDMNAVDEFVYETFREQISNTLKIQMLFDERIKAEEQLNLAVIELEKRNGELKNSYVIDELTGIFNRRGFYMHGGSLYKAAALTGGKAIMCFGDVDGLKKINDTYGHQEGDEAILTTALIIRESFGVDDIVARIGGDEFIIIAANKSSENEINLTRERINSNFNKYNSLSNKPYKLSLSLGFSVYSPNVSVSFDQLIKDADKQLYNQKKKVKCFNL